MNAGAPVSGFVTPVAGLSTVQLSGQSISGWEQARWTLFSWPRGWPTPAGWTLDSPTQTIYSTDITPTLITLQKVGAAGGWGKWLGRLVVNNGQKGGQAGNPDVIDETWGWEVLSPNLGLREVGTGEGTQVDATRAWTDPLQRAMHSIENGGTNGQGYKALETTDATVTTLQTYAMPDHSAVVIEGYALGKKKATTTCAFLAFRWFYIRDGAGPVLVGAATDLGSNANGTAWVLDSAISSNNILTRITGQAATDIEWETNVKVLAVTDTTI